MSKKKLKKCVEDAVLAWQVYHGSTSVNVKYQQRFYNRALKLTIKASEITKVPLEQTMDFVVTEAVTRGSIKPYPAKDY